MLKIEAFDGVSSQVRKFKPHVTLERAIEICKEHANNDYLGLTYSVLDENDNELFSIES